MEIIPSKTALVQSWTTSGLCRISRNSSQLGQPLLANLVPVWTMEHTMQARRLRRDIFACGGGVSGLVWEWKRKKKRRTRVDELQEVFVKFVGVRGVWSSRAIALECGTGDRSVRLRSQSPQSLFHFQGPRSRPVLYVISVCAPPPTRDESIAFFVHTTTFHIPSTHRKYDQLSIPPINYTGDHTERQFHTRTVYIIT